MNHIILSGRALPRKDSEYGEDGSQQCTAPF
jgi:hypothetical protein